MTKHPWAGRVGRSVRDAMRHDTTVQQEERMRHRRACEQAVREREQLFPVLTAENAKEAIRWQETRIKEILEGKRCGASSL